jgi:hypothetical protein
MGPQGAQGIQGIQGISIQWLGSFGTPPSSPSLNQAFYSTSDKKAYIYSGGSWNQMVLDGNPGTPGVSIQWLGNLPTAPTSPSLNQAYYNSSDKKSYIHNGTNWSILTQDGATGSQGLQGIQGNQGIQGIQGVPGVPVLWLGSFPSAPVSPGLNNAYYNETLGKAYVWNGSVWHLVAQDGATGAQGPEGPVVPGIVGQTLKSNGIGWVATSDIYISSGNIGVGTTSPQSLLEVTGGDETEEQPIFSVRNTDGKMVFGVYQSGVRMYVEDDPGKSSRGGFAIGGLADQQKGEKEYFRVTPDSVRVYLREPLNKSSRGGFAIGGLADQTKLLPQNLFYVSYDSARIYIDDTPEKSSRGGFAIGGLADQQKAGPSSFMRITPNNYFIGHESGQSITNFGLYNSTLGFKAGKSLTSGGSNVFIGNQSGQANEIGSSNVFLGYFSGNKNLASYNTFLGYQAGMNNEVGTYNAFIGYNAGLSNTGGSNNVYIGNNAGFANINGFSNVFIGDGAGREGTESSSNVFVGYQSGYNTNGSGSHNVFLGHLSGFSNTTGWSNNFIGQGAGFSNTTGTNNIFIGNDAGRSNTSSSGNTYIGRNAGFNATEYGNIMIGIQAGEFITTGTNNVIMGISAAYQKTAGTNNVILGSSANLLGGNGNENTIIGSLAGREASGSGNVFIGYEAGYFEGGNNKLYISNSSTSMPLLYGDFFPANRMLVVSGNAMHNSNNRNFFVNGTAGGTSSWYEESDGRLKQNVLPITNALTKVLALRGVSFQWNDVANHEAGTKIGFIAQEVKEVVPEVVSGSNDTKFSMQYAPLTAILVEAIKDQNKTIVSQEAAIKMLEQQVNELKTKMDELLLLLKK